MNRSDRIILFILLAFITWRLFQPGSVQAGGAFEWTGEGDNLNWTDACNWHPKDGCTDAYPGKESSDDEATLGAGAYHVIHPGQVTLRSLTIMEGASLQGGDLTVTESFQWLGGATAARITVNSGATMQVTGGRLEDLPTGTGQIDLYGSALWMGGGRIDFLGDTIFNNYGVFTVSGEATFYGFSCCLPPTSSFNNYGLFHAGSPLGLLPGNVTFTALSVVQRGTFNIPSGSVLTLGHGNHELHHASVLSGGGRTIIAELSGEPAIDGTVQLAPGHTLELRSNDLNGAGTFAGGGTFNWTGGDIRGNLTIAAGTELLISGPGDKRLVRQGDSGEINALGPVRWQDDGRVVFAGPAIFNNGGAFEVAGNATFHALSCCNPPTSLFNNNGSFKIDGASSAFRGVFVNTSGAVELLGSTLELVNGARYTQAAGTTRLDGASVHATAPVRIEGGQLEGAGVITGTLYNAGALRPGLPTGTLQVTGGYTQTPEGTLFVEVPGAAAFDRLQVGGAAALAGTLQVSRPGGYVPDSGQRFPILLFGSRSGDFTSKQGLEIGGGKSFLPLYEPGSLTLEVTGQSGADFRITGVALQHQSVASGQWVAIGENGTTDGNLVRATVTVANDGPARSGTLRLVDASSGADVAPPLSVDMAAGASELMLEWDTSGYAWTDGGAPATDLSPEVRLEAGGATAGHAASVLVAPRPVVLVHGLWSNAQAWSNYSGFLAARHPHWKAYAVGDNQFPGVMDTGKLSSPAAPSKTIGQNAAITAGYIRALREAQNAWQVDVVGHSMGGLISRFYVQLLMPVTPQDRPAIHRLIMLGTPNAGSPCAVDFPFQATYELRPDVVADFNVFIDQQRGVPFSILAGNPLPFTCSSWVTGDSVVPVASAFALPYVTDQAQSGSLHTSLNTSASDFASFVLPRLALGPSAVQALRDVTAATPAPAAPLVEIAPPQLFVLETVTVAASHNVPLPVPSGERFGLTLLAPPDVSLYLENPSGVVVDSIPAGDSRAQEPIRAFNIANPLAGTWNLRLENGAGEPATVAVSAWVHGNPVTIELATEPAAQSARLLVTLRQGAAPVANAAVTANLTDSDGGSQELLLLDDGRHGDGAAGDGVYGGALDSLAPGDYLVVARANTAAGFRATTGSVTVRSGHTLFLPLVRR